MRLPGFSAEASHDRAVGRYRTRQQAGRNGAQAVTPQDSTCDVYMQIAVAYAKLASRAIDSDNIPAALDYLDKMETYGTAWEGCEAVTGPSL